MEEDKSNPTYRWGKTKKSKSLRSKATKEVAYRYIRRRFLDYNFSTEAVCSQETVVTYSTTEEGDYTDLGRCVRLPSTYQTARCILPEEYEHCRTDSAHDEFY